MSRNVEADYYKKTSDDRVPVKWMVWRVYFKPFFYLNSIYKGKIIIIRMNECRFYPCYLCFTGTRIDQRAQVYEFEWRVVLWSADVGDIHICQGTVCRVYRNGSRGCCGGRIQVASCNIIIVVILLCLCDYHFCLHHNNNYNNRSNSYSSDHKNTNDINTDNNNINTTNRNYSNKLENNSISFLIIIFCCSIIGLFFFSLCIWTAWGFILLF